MAERQFGPYRLVQQIASGGMAEIHLARTRGLGGFEKAVALKMIHPNFSSDEHFVQMLVDEAKLTVQLQHVNIAQVFDLGRVGDTFYITMEFVDGVDLYKILRRASEIDLPMPIEVAVHIAREVAAGLEYAHAKGDDMGKPLGIVHRDISPQNILISHAGEVKVVDFGIAKAASRAKQTAVGVIKGKYYYMSPEQAWGDPLDHRTDLFSAGILLYEMLAGQMLYLEEDLHRLLDMVRKADIAPPSTKRPDVPPELDRLVMRALSKKPENRFQSAQDFQVALDQFLRRRAPDFTTSRVTTFVRKVLGLEDEEEPREASASQMMETDESPALTIPPPPRTTGQRLAHTPTRAMHRDDILSRAEFHDENSVIFNPAELKKVHEAAQPTPEMRARASRSAANEIASMGAATPIRRAPLNAPITEDGDSEDEATVMSGAPMPDMDHDVLDGPLDQDEEVPTRIELDSSTFARELAARGGPSRDGNVRPGVSAITPPRRSRRTPPQGAPVTGPAPGRAHPRPGSANAFAATVLAEQRGAVPTVIGPGVGSGRIQMTSSGASPSSTPVPPAPSHPGHASLAIAPVAIVPATPTPYPAPLYGAPGPSWTSEPTPGGFAQPWDGAPEARVDLRTTWSELLRSRNFLIGLGIAVVSLVLVIILASTLGSKKGATPPTSLEIVSIPEGASVFLDGTPRGKAPLALDALEAGKAYDLKLELDRHEPWVSTQETIEGKSVKVIAALKPIMGALHVESNPSGAEVYLGPQALGRTPLTRTNLDPFIDGTVEVRLRGFKPERLRLEWAGKREASLTFTLQPAHE